MSSIRTSLTSLFALARGETRLALAGAPQFVWRLLGVAGWASIAIFAGLLIGFAAVALPPMAMAGIVVPFVLFLLWVIPDGFVPPERLIRRLFLIALFADICLNRFDVRQERRPVTRRWSTSDALVGAAGARGRAERVSNDRAQRRGRRRGRAARGARRVTHQSRSDAPSPALPREPFAGSKIGLGGMR